MAENAFNWDRVTGASSERLRGPKLPPMPPQHFIKLAQASYDGDPQENGDVWHARHFTFPEGTSDEVIGQALTHLKNAGSYTSPMSTVRTYRDETNPYKIGWEATGRRGRKTSV